MAGRMDQKQKQQQPRRRSNLPFSPNKAKRYGSPQRPDAAVMRNTKSEARVWFRDELFGGVLPDGFQVVEIK